MERLSVILAPPGDLGHVRSILHDWSTAGLVEAFAWVDSRGTLPSGDYLATRVGVDGAMIGTTLQNLIADLAPSQMALCVLVPGDAAVAAVPAEVEQGVATLLGRAVAGGLNRIRLVAARAGQRPALTEVAHEGWHNLVLAPEDRITPVAPAVAIGAQTPEPVFGAHIAAAAAGILGLWTGMPGAAVTGPPSPGRSARLVASYYRRLVATDAEEALRHAVTAMDSGLPRPNRHGITMVHVNNPQGAIEDMATSWFKKHVGSLRGPRDSVPQAEVKPITLGAALKMFFGYMLAALKGAPGAWAARLKAGIASGIAGAATRAIYGTGSAYTVVVGGLTGDGTPASWLSIVQGSAALESALDQAQVYGPQERHTELGQLWEDLVAAALTLADGQQRAEGLPPVQAGPDQAVMPAVELIAPPNSAAFFGVPGQLAALLDIGEIPPADVLAALDLDSGLAALTNVSGVQFEAGSTREKLAQWRSAVRVSFTVRVAEFVGNLYLETMAEVRSLLERLGQAAGAAGDEDATVQRRLAKRIRWMCAGALVAILIVVGLILGGILAGILGPIIAVAVFLLGFIGVFWTYWRGQQALFQAINRRQALASQAVVDGRNLRAALADVRRITGAYGQLQDWSRVIARFLSEPYGRSAAVSSGQLRLTGPMPRGMRIGHSEPDQVAVAQIASALRRELYSVGWLSQPWEATLADAARRLGPSTGDSLDTPRAMYGKPSAIMVGQDSLLSRWARIIDEQGIGEGGDGVVWSSVMARMEAMGPNEVANVTGRISVLGQSDATAIGLEDFMRGIDDVPQGSVMFDEVLLSPTAATRGASVVITREPWSRQKGFDRSAALTLLSVDIPGYEYLTTQDPIGAGDSSGSGMPTWPEAPVAPPAPDRPAPDDWSAPPVDPFSSMPAWPSMPPPPPPASAPAPASAPPPAAQPPFVLAPRLGFPEPIEAVPAEASTAVRPTEPEETPPELGVEPPAAPQPPPPRPGWTFGGHNPTREG